MTFNLYIMLRKKRLLLRINIIGLLRAILSTNIILLCNKNLELIGQSAIIFRINRHYSLLFSRTLLDVY